MTRNFRAVNAEFNALYNGNLALEQGKKGLAQTMNDDYFEILPIERIQVKEEIQLPGQTRNSDFERAEDKAVVAIQKHSIYFDGKEHNPQIDEAYMMLGQARYYDSRFIPALEAFNFILHRYPTSNSVNAAKIWREKTNIRLQNEEVAINNLKKLFEQANIEDKDFADASAMMAQAYINLEMPDSAVVHIKNAAKYTRDNETKGRLLYIKGQLYNTVNQKDSANLAFDEVIDLNRKSPRIYMINAKMEKIKNFDYETGDTILLEEHLEKLAKDRENRFYLDIIHHQRGQFYRNTENIQTAISAYNKSIKEFKQNERLQASNYEALGDIYFDKAEYKTAGDYFDSTLQRLVENTRDHRQIKKKRDNLEDVIRYENSAQANDSILQLVNMSPSERLAFFTIHTKKLKEKALADSLMLLKNNASLKNNEFFSGGRDRKKDEAGTFYFYNTTAAAFGRQEFRRQWGDRKLEDNWRRSNKSVILDSGEVQSEIVGVETTSIVGDSFLPETYLALIPTDQKVIDSITTDRNMAYYQLGLIYREKFKEYHLAENRLETLISHQPEERLLIPAKYHLYKTYELLENNSKVQQYKNDIVTNHPDSRYAEIINNPSAILAADESSPEYRYYEVYQNFENQQYAKVIEDTDRYIKRYIGDPMVPKFELLKAIAIGRQNGFEDYKKALSFVALNYPNSEEGQKANSIYQSQLNNLEKFDFEANNKSDRWKLIYEFDVNSREEAKAFQEKINKAIEELQFTYLDTSLDYYNASKVFVVVHGLFSKEGAKGFAETLKENRKFRITHPYTEISSPNYEVVQVHKNLKLYNNKNN